MTEWQDISTAPKTSKSILVWVPSNKCVFAVTWGEYHMYDESIRFGWLIFGGSARSFLNNPEQGPSHWQPTPEPPE